MKKRVFLAAALIVLTTAAVFAQRDREPRPPTPPTPTTTPVAPAPTLEETFYDFQIINGGKEVQIDKYKGSPTGGLVDIPIRLQNLPVRVIGKDAFKGRTDITYLSIPPSVTSIEEGAFYGCTSLVSAGIPDSVTSIGRQAFYGCTSLWAAGIGIGVKSMGFQAFTNTGLTQVNFYGTMDTKGFGDSFIGPTMGDLKSKFYAKDKNNGTPGRYTRPSTTSATWTWGEIPTK